MRKLFVICFLAFSGSLMGQDLIKTIYGDEIKVKIVEITKEVVKYNKLDDQSKTVHSMGLSNIEYVAYENGTIKRFNKKENIESEKGKENIITPIPADLKSLAAKGKKVYLSCENENAVEHATYFIQRWGYWTIAKTKADADFIININLRFNSFGVCFAFAQFKDTKKDDILYTTIEVNSSKDPKTFDFNTKRSAMNELVEQALKPVFK